MTEHLLSMLGLALRGGAAGRGRGAGGRSGTGQEGAGHLCWRGTRRRPPSAGRTALPTRAAACACRFPADKDALGRALGRTSVAMCAVTDIGFAAVAGEEAGGGGRRDLRRGVAGAGHQGQARQGAARGAGAAREEPAAGQAARSRRQAAGGTGAPAGRPSGAGSADRPGGLTARTGYIRNAAAAMRKADGSRGRKRPDSGMRTLCR